MGTAVDRNAVRGLARLSQGLLRYGCAAAVAAAITLPSAALGATVTFRIDRTSTDPEARTFSGAGMVTFTGLAADPAGIDALSLQISTTGEDFGGAEIIHVFTYAATDIASVSGLVMAGSGLAGSILFDGKPSATGEAFMDDLFLDFDAGVASGFCFSSGSGEEQCIFGGGTSSSVEADLGTAPVPLPAAMPLLALAMGMIAGLRQARRLHAA